MTTHHRPPTHGPAMNGPDHGNGVYRAMRPDATRDDATRYLCAAAHLDGEFANRAVREFLVENTRPVPPSAGVDAAAVLGEAVAARTRRKLRDATLIVLMIGMLFVIPVEMLAGWLAFAVLLFVPAMATALRNQGLPAKPALYLAGAVVVLAVVVIIWPAIEQLLADSSSSTSTSPLYPYEPLDSSTEEIVETVLMVLGIAALLAVLLADRLVVWKHLDERFWPKRPTTSLARTYGRAVYQFTPETFLTQLRRYVFPQDTAAASPPHEPPPPARAEPAPLIVYRDYVPFVGAGKPEDPWSIAVPLEELPDAEPRLELTTEALYGGIRREIESLRDAVTLAPGRRLGHLDIGERVIVSADELVDHLDDASAADFLDQPGVAPFTMLRPERVRSIKADPVEWARYYQCYQVETWDRDLVVSAFVHVAVGTGALYVEWTPCVLRPIKKEYRKIDTMSRSLWRPLLGAVLDLIRVPASIPVRLVQTFSFIRTSRQPHGIVDPDAYGVAVSLRELAAAQRVDNYFQTADIDRYLKMMESRLILAVSRTMHAAGYSPASFDAQAATVVNTNISIGGSVGGNVVAGAGNKVTAPPRQRTRTG